MGYAFKYSPAISAVPIVQSDSTVHSPPIRALHIFTAGTVVVRTPAGQTIEKIFPAAADGGCYPYVWELPIDMVLDTGTTVIDAALLGYRE